MSSLPRLMLGLLLASFSLVLLPGTGEAQTSPQSGSWGISFGGANSSLTLSNESGWVELRGGGDSYVCYMQSGGLCEGSWSSAAGNHGSFRMTFHSDFGNGYMLVEGYWWYDGESYADGRALNGSFRY